VGIAFGGVPVDKRLSGAAAASFSWLFHVQVGSFVRRLQGYCPPAMSSSASQVLRVTALSARFG
jgi:hypothetical protein